MKKALLIVFSGLMLTACGSKEKKKDEATVEEAQAVSVITPSEIKAYSSIKGSGVLSSKSELKLAFKTGGLIKRMYVKEGQFVKKGQLLAQLDMAEIDAGVNQAKLGLQKAERDLEKVKKLFADEVATKSSVEDATTAYNVAKETVESAIYNQRLSSIYAPESGTILLKIAEQGELITPFAPALILGTGSSSFNVNIGLSDKDIVKVKNGNKAEVTLDAYPGEIFSATVSQIAQTVNPATGTYEAELTLNSKGKRLISGFVANAEIYTSSSQSALVVPIESIVEADGNSASVFVLKGLQVEKRTVETGSIMGEQVQIFKGLSVNEKIVSKGANFLSDGQKVKVID